MDGSLVLNLRCKRHQPSVNDLPDEVLQVVLYFLPAEDILCHIQRVSKRFYDLCSQPLLWRYHCVLQFKYWDSKHRLHQKLAGEVGDIDWKALYLYRRGVDDKTTRFLESILEAQVDRIQHYKSIAGFGYNAKDTLLRHCRTDDDAPDVLARRYYANSVLDHIHRAEALAEWTNVARGKHVPLERALGSFDLFVLHDQYGDLLEISTLLDNLEVDFRVEYPSLDELPTRRKALATVSFLRARDLTGIESELAYRDLQNNYIGIALQDRRNKHPSLPLISVAIFCGLAQRVGLDARCCGVPNHVHAMVYPPVGETLDGRGLNEYEEVEPMYLDPYRSDDEITKQTLHRMLQSWGISPQEYSRFLSESTPTSLILRTSKNILATVHEFRGHAGSTGNTGHPTIHLHANPFADMENAFYSALWANFVFGRPVSTPAGADSSEAFTQRQFIPLILERFESVYPMDASLIEDYICPMFNRSSNAEHWEIREALRVVRAADSTPKQVRLRDTKSSQDGVKYKVGQVFRHRRYNYLAVITGWDVECGMNPDWIVHNSVDSLSRGRHQSFYHALVEDTSIRYVAEESMEIIKIESPTTLMSLAGRFFKRWDKENHVFVSNIRDEYPED
ncbi:hemimethylated DNA binding domain-containing protein [Tricladium varicosporioides]|nr:hemimethylated DNA binding domain-containing protein [Hymenoscyphus varicosporioides]